MSNVLPLRKFRDDFETAHKSFRNEIKLLMKTYNMTYKQTGRLSGLSKHDVYQSLSKSSTKVEKLESIYNSIIDNNLPVNNS